MSWKYIKNYPQVCLEERKYNIKKKKMDEFIYVELYFDGSDNSDDSNDSNYKYLH